MARIARKDMPPGLLAQLGESVPKSTKYHSTPTVVDGIRFHSKLEANRWCELVLMEKAKVIRDLERQRRFPLNVNGKLVTTYTADFVYIDTKTKRIVVEDVKGFCTKEYVIKRALFEAVYGFAITEVS